MRDFRLPLDETLFHWGNANSENAFAHAGIFFSSRVFGISIFLTLVALTIYQLEKRKALLGCLQLIVTICVSDRFGSYVLKPLFARARPPFVLSDDQMHLWVNVAKSGSFPSLHAANAFACLVTVFLLGLPFRIFWIFVAISIAVSRVIVGVHWPSDILGGALYGTLVGLGMHLIFQKFQQPKSRLTSQTMEVRHEASK